MNTADATGDLLFDLFEVLITPLTCFNGTQPATRRPNPCANPEATGADLVVNKVTLEVDDRYSLYGACNLGINGTDPLNHTCPTDTYCCDCYRTVGIKPIVVPCRRTMGRENVKEQFTSFLNVSEGCQAIPGFMPDPRPADCYTINLLSKLEEKDPGYWYSSLDSGYCAPGETTAACTWRVVSVDKIVDRGCHTAVFGAIVQEAGDPACLDGCGDQRTNFSSPCWVDCFYKAALGPDSGKISGKVTGLSLAALKAAWTKPFLPESEGGCPALPERQPWFAGRPEFAPAAPTSDGGRLREEDAPGA